MIKRIAIIDDHSLFLKGMEELIMKIIPGSEVLTFSSFQSFLDIGRKTIGSLDLLVSDIELPNEDTLEFLREVRHDFPDLPITVVSMHKKLAVVRVCRDIGVLGYLLKDDDQVFDQIIQQNLQGVTAYSPSVEKFYRSFSIEFERLSIREEELLRLTCQGHNNQSIADQLHISSETVKTHKRNIKQKLGFDEFAEAVEFAKENLIL